MKRTCVFCGSSPVTREHVFPRWLAKVLPEQERWRGQDIAAVSGEQVSAPELPVETRLVGDVFTEITVSRVCASCNGGWMNDLEREVRDVLTMMMLGKTGPVDIVDSVALAMWVAKTAMLAEFTSPSSAVSRPDDFVYLYQRRSPPPGMYIWALASEGEEGWGLRMQHYGILLAGSSNNSDQAYNTRSTTIGLGGVAFHIQSTTTDVELPNLCRILPLNPTCLWPDVHAFYWDRGQSLGDEDLWFVSDYLRLFLGDDDEQFDRRITALALRHP